METFKFVIVGHVDHGKSTLIGRFLFDTGSLSPDKMAEIRKASKGLGRDTEFAYIVDNFEEERRQGITIDTTQAFFKTEKREYVIIDAPGHVEFVKNMVTGASQAEGALLIVDAKEGVREQTKRHAYILSLLGIKQVIAVFNKMDLTGYSKEAFDSVKKDLEGFLSSIKIEPLHCIPISAIKGDNVVARSGKMDWYDGPTISESLDSLKARAEKEAGPLIFPVQDIYRVGDTRIIAGRIESGTMASGGEVKILPEGTSAKIQSIHKYPGRADKASSGESIGIEIERDKFVNRGDVLCAPGREPMQNNRIEATIFWMSKKELKAGDRINIRCATHETTCKISTIKERIDSSTLEILEKDADQLKNLEVGEVIIETKKPIVFTPFNNIRELGRFVLVRDENICAGGIIREFEKALYTG